VPLSDGSRHATLQFRIVMFSFSCERRSPAPTVGEKIVEPTLPAVGLEATVAGHIRVSRLTEGGRWVAGHMQDGFGCQG
jgi:hypothetical protein